MANNKNKQKKQKKSTNQTKKRPMELHRILKRYIPILLVNILIITVLGYFISPWSKVGTVSVEGNEAVYVQEIIDSSNIHGGDSVISIMNNQEKIENNITDQLEQVSETSVELVGANDIMVQVDEFNTVAYIAEKGSYLRVSENGRVLDAAYNISLGNQPVLSNFEEGEALDSMIEELSQLDESILNLISEIELTENRSNPLFIQVFMNNGNRVLSSIPEFSEKIPYSPEMVQAVEGEKGVFDMEAGVYFLPFAKEEEEEIDADTEVDESARQELEEFNE